MDKVVLSVVTSLDGFVADGDPDAVRRFLEAGAGAELCLIVTPVLLGGGTPVFAGTPPVELLVKSARLLPDGTAELRYSLKGSP